jgi:chromatin assembly factor 1 subunit B
VQGVAWDPMNEYIATQSSDRSMHVYRISTKHGTFEAHAIGKNMRMTHHHSRAPSTSSSGRPRPLRADSVISDAESTHSEQHKEKDDAFPGSISVSGNHYITTPLTPVTSVASTPSASMFPPPPIDNASSRRSSFSGSNAPGSPCQFSRYGRSPSPMPALPAIRTLPSAAAAVWASVKLYGDESFTNFFRRLTFSPDGGLLLTPAGQFEDPSVIPASTLSPSIKAEEITPARGRKGRQSGSASETDNQSSVYIYSRANFARPPIAQLPGHKKASVAVRFSPVLYELRQGVVGPDSANETKTAVLEKGKEGLVVVDILGAASNPSHESNAGSLVSPRRTPGSASSVVAPTPRLAGPFAASGPALPMSSPTLSPTDVLRPPTPAMSKPSTPTPHTIPSNTGSVFALPYRMLFAVVTMDTVAIYDTQQSGPVCMLTKLHYDEFTDMTWCVPLRYT